MCTVDYINASCGTLVLLALAYLNLENVICIIIIIKSYYGAPQPVLRSEQRWRKGNLYTHMYMRFYEGRH